MNTRTTDDVDISPKRVSYQGQTEQLNAVEGKYDAEPSQSALAWSAGLSVTEFAALFVLLHSSGWLIASAVAAFPVLLLWAMANYVSDHAEIHKHNETLIKEYDNAINNY